MRKRRSGERGDQHGQNNPYYRHGACGTPTYVVWHNMRARCNNPNYPTYHRYGGRGITICKRWDKFENFLSDMGEKPEGLSLERRNNNRGYTPANCVWATRTEQMRNTRFNRLITYRGETLCVSAWAERLGVPWHQVKQRGLKRIMEELL